LPTESMATRIDLLPRPDISCGDLRNSVASLSSVTRMTWSSVGKSCGDSRTSSASAEHDFTRFVLLSGEASNNVEISR
jgi:hypothetical protein